MVSGGGGGDDGQLMAPLLERRIIKLLTTTNLTFKEIILKLDGEQLQASIGIIRRINRDNRYRRPRYDSKLTPAQRESLVKELRDHQGVKPNLSLLAKRYGVCHGSVWYWWDKLNRIRRFNGVSGGDDNLGNSSQLAKTTSRLFKRSPLIISMSSPTMINSNSSSASSSSSSPTSSSNSSSSSLTSSSSSSYWLDYPRHELIGRVRVVANDTYLPIELPILMFTKVAPSSLATPETQALDHNHHHQNQHLIDIAM